MRYFKFFTKYQTPSRMKNILFCTIVIIGYLVCPKTGNAQVAFSSQLGFNYLKINDIKILSYNTTSKVGVKLNDKFEVGGMFGYYRASWKQIGVPYYYISSVFFDSIDLLSIGVYGRFNAVSLEKLRLLIESDLIGGMETFSLDKYYRLNIFPVIQVAITPKVSFDMSFGVVGLSLISIPPDYLEVSLGQNSKSSYFYLEDNEYAGTLSAPIQFGVSVTF